MVGAVLGMAVGYGTARLAAPHVCTAVRNANVRQATLSEAAALEQARSDLRLTSNRQRSKNLAIGEGNIEGQPYRQVAVSGEKSPKGTVGSTNQNEQRIRTSPTQRDIERGQGTPERRAHDTEIKILEDVKDKTKNNPNVKGEITITSELPICPSCYRAITNEFHQHRPNIKINGVETQRPNMPDKLPGPQRPVTPPVVLPPGDKEKRN